jgi:hypothetical protein
MAKKRKRTSKGKKATIRRTSSLSAHARQGKKFVPPLMTLPNVAFTNWLTDVFPDMLWLCSVISIDLDDGRRAVTPALNLIDEVLEEAEVSGSAVMGGRLTSLETVPETARAR